MHIFLSKLAKQISISRFSVLADFSSHRLQISLTAIDSQTIFFSGISLKSSRVILLLGVELRQKSECGFCNAFLDVFLGDEHVYGGRFLKV